MLDKLIKRESLLWHEQIFVIACSFFSNYSNQYTEIVRVEKGIFRKENMRFYEISFIVLISIFANRASGMEVDWQFFHDFHLSVPHHKGLENYQCLLNLVANLLYIISSIYMYNLHTIMRDKWETAMAQHIPEGATPIGVYNNSFSLNNVKCLYTNISRATVYVIIAVLIG